MTSPSQQKLRVVGPTVVTANRLSDGKVLYRAADEGWTTRLEAAAVVTTTEAARELLAAAVREDTEAVDAYAAPVAICDGCIEPGNLRERIRAAARHSRCQQREAIIRQETQRDRPVYVYDDFDRTLVAERLREFRDQVARRLSGELTEDGFKPLRLMNGVYLQLHAYVCLRVFVAGEDVVFL